jgi:hypothetical protein
MGDYAASVARTRRAASAIPVSTTLASNRSTRNPARSSRRPRRVSPALRCRAVVATINLHDELPRRSQEVHDAASHQKVGMGLVVAMIPPSGTSAARCRAHAGAATATTSSATQRTEKRVLHGRTPSGGTALDDAQERFRAAP